MEYIGRMVCDGEGNLLADEGERAGYPIAYDEDSDTFVFIKQGEPSHNERHHKQFAGIVGTQDVDPDLPGYAGTKDKPTKGNEHHFDAHPGHKQDPDSIAKLTGGHTHQHKGGI